MACMGGFCGQNIGGVDKDVGEDAGKETAADQEYCRIAETDGSSAHDLQQGVGKLVTQEQIDDVSGTKGQGRYKDRHGHIGFAKSLKEQSPEDHFLQKAYRTHTEHIDNRFGQIRVPGDAGPEVGGADDDEGHKPQIVFFSALGLAQTVVFLQTAPADIQIENHG